MLRHDLRIERGGGALEQRLSVGELHRHANLLQDLLGRLGGLGERLADDGRMDALGEELGGGLEKSASHHNNGGRAIAGLDVLRLGQLDEHLGRRMHDLHLLEDGRAVVGDGHAAIGRLDHLVHALWSETCAHGVGHRLRRNDVALAHSFRLCAVLECARLVACVGVSHAWRANSCSLCHFLLLIIRVGIDSCVIANLFIERKQKRR